MEPKTASEDWEMCDHRLWCGSDSPPEQNEENPTDSNMSEEAHTISELKEEIGALHLIIRQMKTASIKPSAKNFPLINQSLRLQLDKVKLRNRLKNKSNTCTGKNGTPHKSSIWAITNLGEIFVNEHFYKNPSSFNSTHPRSNVSIQEMDFTGASTPVIIPLDKGCNPGTEITITGYIPDDAERMHINLDSEPICKDTFEAENVNFHFNPRFDNDPYEQGVVVRNTKTNGGWGHEERVGEMPFILGTEFTFKITSHFDCYKVYINGEFYCSYKHRLPPYAVRALSIWRDVKPYTVIIKNVKPKANPNDLLWQQLGGHLKSIESCRSGITWGIGYDHSVWVYTGGWGGSFFGNFSHSDTNPMIDHEDYCVYENQFYNPVTGYTSAGLTPGDGVGDKEKSVQDLMKVISMDCEWTSDWTIDSQEPGIDSEGWQYITDNGKYKRKRRWFRTCALKTVGPWIELNEKKFLDVSLVSLKGCKSIAWAVTLDGQIEVAKEILKRKNPIWEDVGSEEALTSISCGPYDNVWAIGKDGNAYRRVGINPNNLLGDHWKHVDFPGNIPLKQVSVGTIGVWAVSHCGKLCVRKGITVDLPEGNFWQFITIGNNITESTSNVCFKHVSVGESGVWVITNTGSAIERLGVEPEIPDGVGWNTELSGNWQYLTIRAL